MADPLSFTEFRKSLLAITYRSLEDTAGLCEPELIAERAGLVGKRGWVDRAIQLFEANGWAVVHGLVGGASRVQLTGAGIEEAEAMVEDGWDQIEGSPDAPRAEALEPATAPASDRVVSLDHNSAVYAEAVAGLDAIVERLRGDNELATHQPLEHGQRSAELMAGRTLLDAPQASAGAVEKTLVSALKWFAGQLATSAVAPLILTTLGALGALFGVTWWAN